MKTKIIALAAAALLVTTLTGCAASDSISSVTSGLSSSGNVTDRTDYAIWYTEPLPDVYGLITHQYIVGHPIGTLDPSAIKANAFLVPWRIDFSQVQRTGMPVYDAACTNTKEQVVYIEGYIDLDLSDIGANPHNLPDPGPYKLKGTIHETVTGEAGTWLCNNEIYNAASNGGSIEYVQQVSGDHTFNFDEASNMTGLTVSGADIYLDFSSMNNDSPIVFIWPAGTKIEYAPEGTPVPLEPLAPSAL